MSSDPRPSSLEACGDPDPPAGFCSRVDLNADVGESAADLLVIGFVTSANVACGGHAGDRSSMRSAVTAAVEAGVVVGAHPSYPDRAGFGRVELGLRPHEIVDTVLEQVAVLAEVAVAAGTSVRYLKAHGALYHRLDVDPEAAEAVLAGLAEAGHTGLILLAPPGAALVTAARRTGWHTATEAFCDRAYGPDGRLVDRGVPGAVLADPEAVARQAVALATLGSVVAHDGSRLEIRADSLCLHGDAPRAVEAAAAVRRAVEGAGVAVRPFAA